MYSYRRKPWRQWLATASWRPHGPSITLWRKDISRMLSRNCGEGICSCAPQWRETLSEIWFLFLPFSNPYYKVKTYTIVQYTYSWLTRAASKYRASKKTSWAVTGLWNREPLNPEGSKWYQIDSKESQGSLRLIYNQFGFIQNLHKPVLWGSKRQVGPNKGIGWK